MAILIQMAKDPLPWIKDYVKESYELHGYIFDRGSNKCELDNVNSWIHPDNSNNLFNQDELYIVWGGYDLFTYIRELGKTHWQYNIGNPDFYWNSATSESRCVYCGKARFFFIASNGDEPYYTRRKWILDNEDLSYYPKIGPYRFVDMTMVKSYFDYYRQLFHSGKIKDLGFDFETSGFPRDEDFRITGFSLSCQELSTWFDFRYPLDASDEVKIAAYSEFEKFLDEFDTHLWTYNVQFETFVCARLFNKRYEFQDAEALFVCHGLNWGSLKLNSMKLLNIRGWIDDKDAFVGQSWKVFSNLHSYDELVKYQSGDKLNLNEGQIQELDGALSKLTEMGADWNLFKIFWGSVWGVVPTKILGYYCCLDSYYTVKDAEKLLPMYVESYRTYLNNARLGTELSYTGIRLNVDLLNKVEANMIHLINMGQVFMDQFLLEHNYQESKKYAKGYEFTSRFIRGVERHGRGVLAGDLGKWIIKSFDSKGVIVYSDEIPDRLFDGNEEFINRLKSLIEPLSGWQATNGIGRKKKLINQVTWLLQEYHEVDQNVVAYNQKYNINDNFNKLMEYNNSYKAKTIDSIFSQYKDKINWDRYNELYDYCNSIDHIGVPEIEHCKEFISLESNYEVKQVMELIKNNVNKVNFRNYDEIKLEDWIHKDNFMDCICWKLMIEDKDKPQIAKMFSNVYQEVDHLINRIEVDKYQSMELLHISDKPETISFGSETRPLAGFGGRFANYNSPEMKLALGNIISSDYAVDCKFLDWYDNNWIEVVWFENDPDDFYKDLPIKNEEGWVDYAENGRIKHFKLEMNYEVHKKYYETIPCYHELVHRHMEWYKGASGYLARYCASHCWSGATEGSSYKDMYVNFYHYPRSIDRLMALYLIYFVWSGMFKEYKGYITGPRQGIRNKIKGICEKRDFYEIRTNDPKKAKYYVYEADWQINKKDTKRWASGYRIAA